jgi:multiple sugar transport system permease protein
VILPLSVPALIAVALFHFFFAWNDFFVPLLYLAGKPELQPLSVGIQQYNELYATQPTLIQAAALMTMAGPGRDLLPRPALLHAGRRRDRRREVGAA